MEEVDCSSPVTKNITTEELSEVCPTEDAIGALLESLVDPLLPFKPTSDVPSKELKESVAKQVHAVVLLYNYYHRREHPHLECLSLESFRSLTTVIKPTLLQHFIGSNEVDSEQQQTSSLEKAVVEACNLSTSLLAVASDLSISLKKWPIRKVAILLVDSEKQNCFLRNGTITQGVWSLLEKTIDKEKTAAEELQGEEANFQKASFAAIKEATGVNGNYILILERHLAYSLSEEKTSTRFYIMKCTSQASFSDKIPIEDVLNCMKGALFENSFSEWSTNSKVEYFHLLPYASLIEDWFKRREDSEFVIEKEAETVCDDGNADLTKDSEWSDIREIGSNSKAAASKRSNDSNGRKDAAPLDNSKAKRKPTLSIQNRTLRMRLNDSIFALKARNTGNEMSPCKDSYSNGDKGVSEFEPDSMDYRETRLQKKKVNAERHRYNAPPVSARNSNFNLEEMQATLLDKATSLYETALGILSSKRDKATLQQRIINEEIAQYDKDMQNLKGDCDLQLKLVLESCQDAHPRLSNKRAKFSESTKTSCQKLDDICVENNWLIPNYSFSSSDGGFEAEISISGTRYAKPTRGEKRPNVEEARESAAACLLTKLRNNASSSSLSQVYEMQAQLLKEYE